jgi:hypothetical protein
MLPFAAPYRLFWQTANHCIKLVCEYLPASPVREQAAEDPCLFWWQGGGEKLAALLSW